ncbi:hypothetical protein [Rhizobium sp. NZLR8]|uniref:ATP dependent DNA ligase n=1 Tax=Rhizobium sp. NZLR8 TaxID=2731104 RepID=UPI0038FC75F6
MRDNTPHRGKPFALSDDNSVLDHERASNGNSVISPRTDRVSAEKTRLRNPCSPGKTTLDQGRRKNLVWVQPTLIAEIEYRARTHDGKPRHAAYKGLR